MNNNSYQKFVYKIHSYRLRNVKWNLELPLDEARRNNEIVALADSEVLRFIDELNGFDKSSVEAEIRDIRNELNIIKRMQKNSVNKKKISELYAKLDVLQIKTDYLCLIVDSNKDFERANKGFVVNNIKYKRLTATSNGLKKSIVIYVNENLIEPLRKKLDNGRDMEQLLVPSKFGAYESLVCSASTPVPYPTKVLVVPDCITHFTEEIIKLDDTESLEPKMSFLTEELEYNESDGYGLISPSLAKLYGNEYGVDYLPSWFIIRNSFCKGSVFTFDFHCFAEKIAKNYIVKDAWGEEHDIREVNLILTTSMLKLWKGYKNIDDYIKKCKKNNYTFSITKICPGFLENERQLNYQFIQNYKFNDDDIDELVKPTLEEIKDVLGGDYRKAILYLRGKELDVDNFQLNDNDYITALMIDDRMHNDQFVKDKIHHFIKKRIKEAKFGVLSVDGNYSIVSGDPYSLCQSVFKLPVTGLLNKGEFYSRYYVERAVERVVGFRAPMSCYNNIRKMNIVHNNDIDFWYKYMKTVTIFNSWDSTAFAFNGLDKDKFCPIYK